MFFQSLSWLFLPIYDRIINGSNVAVFVFQPNRPLMVAEFWQGWFDNWGDGHHKMDVEKTTTRVLNILKAGASINLYMFHGMAEYLWHIFRNKHKSIIFRTEVIR